MRFPAITTSSGHGAASHEAILGREAGAFSSQRSNAAGSGVTVSDRMYCEGYPAASIRWRPSAISAGPNISIGRPRSAPPMRSKTADTGGLTGRQQSLRVDGRSYLVEPEPVWLLMIDANVFEPLKRGRLNGVRKRFIDRPRAAGTR